MKHSRATRSLAGALALAACAHMTPACGEDATTDVEVSRVTMKLPGQGWNISAKLPFVSPTMGSPVTVDGERRLLTVGEQGSLDSLVMLVSATRGERGVMTQGECEPSRSVYVHRFNEGQSTFVPLQCLRASGPHRIRPDLAAYGQEFAEAVRSGHVATPPEGYVVSIVVSNQNGASVEIMALAGSHLAGVADKTALAQVPAGMPPGVAAWADKLAEEALGTLSSWSGRMTVPPVVFAPAPAPAPPLPAGAKTALAAPAA